MSSPKSTGSNNNDGYIYLLHEREYVLSNQNIYKIGKKSMKVNEIIDFLIN